VVSGCGEKDREQRTPPREKADRPAKPPPGWRTVRNPAAGFTVAAPRSWSVCRRKGTTVLRSPDRVVALTLAADRSGAGRQKAGTAYARETLAALPGFEGTTEPGVGRVSGSPYRTAVVRASGSVKRSPIPQLITVAVLQRPRKVTYSAVAFTDPAAGDALVLRLLGTFRARPPRQRSGRSG